MDDQSSARKPDNPRRYVIPARCVSFIQKLQGKPNKSGTKENDDATNSATLIRYTRSLKTATWWIAVVGCLGAGSSFLQLCALRSTDQATHDTAIAAKTANETTQAQLSAHLTVPDDPKSILKLTPMVSGGPNIPPYSSVAMTLYVANTGPTWARNVFLDVALTVTKQTAITPIRERDEYRATLSGGPLEIDPQHPRQLDLTQFPYYQLTFDDLDVSVVLTLAYKNIFGKDFSQIKHWAAFTPGT